MKRQATIICVLTASVAAAQAGQDDWFDKALADANKIPGAAVFAAKETISASALEALAERLAMRSDAISGVAGVRAGEQGTAPRETASREVFQGNHREAEALSQEQGPRREAIGKNDRSFGSVRD